MRSLITPVEPRTVEAMAAGMATAGVVNPLRWLRPRHIWWHKVVGSIVTATALSTGGLAATGHLPGPVQRAVSSAVRHIGIDIPGGASESPVTPVPAPSTTTTTSTTTSSTTTSSTSTTTTSSTTTTTAPPCSPARILSATALGTPAPDGIVINGRNYDGALLEFTATTAGDIAKVIVEEVPGEALRSLTRSGNTWTANAIVRGGPDRVGRPITFIAIGCGTATRAAPMTPQAP